MHVHATPRSTLTHIGNWTLGQTLGRGAYAHVRLATHPNGHQAACKILPALHSDPTKQVTWDQTVDAVEAYKEVVLLKALCGAGVGGIVGLEGVIEEGGWTYVFLTLYPRSASSVFVPWPRQQFNSFFRRLLYTVDALHSLNVSHEDLKRSNVLVDHKCRPILVDFGFSHFKTDGGMVRSAGGTLDYSSPEKVADILYDPKANDVWALGILMTKLLGMQHPFCHDPHDDTSTMVRKRIRDGDALFPWRKQDQGAGGLAELVEGMLLPDPVARWKISKILEHPWLAPISRDPPRFTPPSLLPFNMQKVSPAVIQDLCFLSYLEDNFRLCETPQKIISNLASKKPCWEKRWAGMLGAWSKRAEMDWEDIPSAVTPLKGRGELSQRSSMLRPLKSGALKEIHLSPNVNMQIPLPSLMPTIVEQKVEKENVPPNMPRKSRMYGMKTREDSQNASNGTAIRSRIALQPLSVSPQPQSSAQDQGGKAMSKIPAATKAKIKTHTKAIKATSPKGAIVRERTKVGAVTVETKKQKMPTKPAPEVIVIDDDASEERAVTAKQKKRLPPSQRQGAASATGSNDKTVKTRSSNAQPVGATVREKVGPQIAKERNHIATAAQDESPPDQQLQGLLLSQPAIGEPRRRSPRFQGREAEEKVEHRSSTL